MGFRAFYACHSTMGVVDSARAVEIELDWAANKVFDILRGDGDFFGLTDGKGTTLQFRRQGDQVLMEIPVPAKSGSYGKTIPILEVRSVIKALPPELSVEGFDGLQFQAW